MDITIISRVKIYKSIYIKQPTFYPRNELDILRTHTCNFFLPEDTLMDEPAHFLNNHHYQFKIYLTSDFDDQITWELPHSSQP